MHVYATCYNGIYTPTVIAMLSLIPPPKVTPRHPPLCDVKVMSTVMMMDSDILPLWLELACLDWPAQWSNIMDGEVIKL